MRKSLGKICGKAPAIKAQLKFHTRIGVTQLILFGWLNFILFGKSLGFWKQITNKSENPILMLSLDLVDLEKGIEVFVKV
jgi:hypothetical protein